MSALMEGFKALGLPRLIAMAVVGAAMLLMVAFLAVHGNGGGGMTLLYGSLDSREAGQIGEVLDRARIAYEVAPDGTRVSVAATEVARARALLAKEGLPTGGSIGYEIFDRSDGLIASQFQQSINQARALEGELERSIRMIAGVRAARVHLVLPKRQPFSQQPDEAQASIVLTLAGPGRMDREGVQAVLTLVSAAVPGLRPQNVGIIDSRGNLLARAGATSALTDALEEQRIGTEQRLSHAVEDMIQRIVGPGHVRAETAIEMGYDQVHETEEKYDPDGKVERSIQNTSSNSRSTDAAQNVSVANNLPNADAGTSPSGSQEQQSQETTNYEIGKTVRTVVHSQPQIRKISLAVLIDQVQVKASDGSAKAQDRPADELDRIAALARTAIGYDEKRGDHVEVVSLPFTEPEAGPPEHKLQILGVTLDKADMFHIGQMAMIAVLLLGALLLVLRPMALQLALAKPMLASGAADAASAVAGQAEGPGAEGDRIMEQKSPGTGPLAISGPAGADAGADRLVTLNSVEGAMRASSLRHVAELVDKHPEETLAVMRSWIARENA